MDIEVNYKNKKCYKTAKYPLHQGKFWTWLIWVLSKIALMGKKYKVETIGMEDLKPPYMLLSNHMHFIDFELAAMGTWPHPEKRDHQAGLCYGGDLSAQPAPPGDGFCKRSGHGQVGKSAVLQFCRNDRNLQRQGKGCLYDSYNEIQNTSYFCKKNQIEQANLTSNS